MAKLLVLPVLLLLATQVSRSPSADSAANAGTWEQRYARARLGLADAGLRRVELMNQRVANATPASVVAEYRDDVVLARARLSAAQSGESVDAFKFWVQRAAAASRSALEQAAGAEAANRTLPNTVKPPDLARLQGQAEVLKLLAERARQLEGQPAAAQLAWQLEFLQFENEQVHEELFRIGRNGGLAPVWPY
jgi:hypothetical protein